jgi:hypothetical protein
MKMGFLNYCLAVVNLSKKLDKEYEDEDGSILAVGEKVVLIIEIVIFSNMLFWFFTISLKTLYMNDTENLAE